MQNKVLYGLTGAIAMGAIVPAQAQKKPMNIVFIMSDDHSYQTISTYNKHFISTPNIDWLADNGAKFQESLVANSFSGPSRTCMLTGKHNHVGGFTDNSKTFDDGQQTFPKLLQKQGYQTAMAGRWHLTSLPTGFNYWDIFIGQGDYYNPGFLSNGKKIRRPGYVTDITANMAINWMEDKRNENKPFCLLMCSKAPYRVWNPDTCNLRLYDDVTYPLPKTFHDDYAGRLAAQKQEMGIIKDMDLVYDDKMTDKESEVHTTTGLKQWGRGNYKCMTLSQRAQWDSYYDPIIKKFKEDEPSGKALAEWKYQHYMHDYMHVIHSADRDVDRVIEYLRQHGLLDNTMIVYTSDQGFYMGEHGWFDKRFVYEESFRAPLLVYYPGGKHGVVKEMVQNIDYAPTFLEVAGAKVSSDIQGRSFLPLLEGKKPANWRQSLYYHYYEYPAEYSVRRRYDIRTKRYLLMYFYNDISAWELYGLKGDPNQMHNIYGKPGTEKLTKNLKK